MRKKKTVKININEKTKKDFVVMELTIKEIIDLSQLNPLFEGDISADPKTAGKDENSVSEPEEIKEDIGLIDVLGGEIRDFTSSAKKIMEASCEFDMAELFELTPSDVEKVFEGWREVNQTFLQCLEKVGILEALLNIIRAAILDFSETFAT